MTDAFVRGIENLTVAQLKHVQDEAVERFKLKSRMCLSAAEIRMARVKSDLTLEALRDWGVV